MQRGKKDQRGKGWGGEDQSAHEIMREEFDGETRIEAVDRVYLSPTRDLGGDSGAVCPTFARRVEVLQEIGPEAGPGGELCSRNPESAVSPVPRAKGREIDLLRYPAGKCVPVDDAAENPWNEDDRTFRFAVE